jgi:hypothetical protein
MILRVRTYLAGVVDAVGDASTMSVTVKSAGSQGSVSLWLVRVPERVDDLRTPGSWLRCPTGEGLGTIGRCHVPEDARRWRVEVEHVGSEVLEPSFSKQTCQLVGGRRRSGRGGAGTAGLGYHSDPPAGPQQPGEFA